MNGEINPASTAFMPTVLTDERIDWLAIKCGVETREVPQDFIRNFAREVVAQAGQVAVPGWISVEDRLPDDDCQVLAATWFTMTHEQHQDIVSFRRGTGKFSHSDVTHWMPLPPSPAKESK